MRDAEQWPADNKGEMMKKLNYQIFVYFWGGSGFALEYYNI